MKLLVSFITDKNSVHRKPEQQFSIHILILLYKNLNISCIASNYLNSLSYVSYNHKYFYLHPVPHHEYVTIVENLRNSKYDVNSLPWYLLGILTNKILKINKYR